MTDKRLTEKNERYWHMDPNPDRTPFAPGVTPEFTICRSCSAFVWDEDVHNEFHDNSLTRHATFAVQDHDGSTFVQFIDGTTTTLPAFLDGSGTDADVIEDLMRDVNRQIDPDFDRVYLEGGQFDLGVIRTRPSLLHPMARFKFWRTPRFKETVQGGEASEDHA